MRAVIHQALVGDGALMALLPTERWFQQGSVIDVPRKPFAILRWIAAVPGNAQQSYAHQLQVQIYDDRGTYQDIDRILGGPHRSGGVWSILSGITNLEGADGRVTQCDYLGQSSDDVDVDFKANTKYSSWQIIGRTTN